MTRKTISERIFLKKDNNYRGIGEALGDSEDNTDENAPVLLQKYGKIAMDLNDEDDEEDEDYDDYDAKDDNTFDFSNEETKVVGPGPVAPERRFQED